MAPIHYSSIPSSIENDSAVVKSAARPAEANTLHSIQTSRISSDTAPSTLHRRASQMVSIPNTYGDMDSSPAPGVVAGIVLGTVGGVLIILYLIYIVFGLGPARVVDEEVVRRGSRSRSPYLERSEMSEVTRSRSRTPLPRSRSRRDRVVVEESYTASSGMDEDDVVEVFEEHSPSPPPRRGGRQSSGYRTVDPHEYAGGGRPTRHVRR